MPEPAQSEIYVGWRERMAPPLARFLRARGACLAALLLATVAGLVAAQRPFASSVHEFGFERELEGWISERPYPMLRVSRPGASAPSVRVSSYLLVARGKHGAAERVRGLEGARVRVIGTLIYRGSATMLELSDAPLERLDPADPPPAAQIEDLGTRELSGVIVDSKCFLGVMKPGEFKVHRACAARCLSGGVPPLFVVSGAAGTTALLLASSSGSPAERDALIAHVAEPLRIVGYVRRVDDWWILSADPASYERLE